MIFTFGNHEAEFLYDSTDDKATASDGVDKEMSAWHLTPVAIASGADVRRQWLRDRPFAVRVGARFFAHAGNTKGRTIPAHRLRSWSLKIRREPACAAGAPTYASASVMLRFATASIVILAALSACGTTAANDAASSAAASSKGEGRDFKANPTIFETDDAGEVYAVSDPHGEYDVLVGLLAGNALVDRAASDPTKVHWTGGAATLVVVGDLIDKGAKSLETIDLLRSLQSQAPASGGQVIVTMGNHEAEFFADPKNSKATGTGLDTEGIDVELAAQGIDPKALAAGTDPEGRGRWLQSLPLGARVKKWFFAHAGNTQKLSIKDLSQMLEKSLSNNGFDDKDITGNDSILESESWYGNPGDKNAGSDEVNALNDAKHIVFGHDPGAFGKHGRILQTNNGLLVKLDTAMGLHDDGAGGSSNPAYLLHISTQGTDTTEVLDANGASSKLDTP